MNGGAYHLTFQTKGQNLASTLRRQLTNISCKVLHVQSAYNRTPKVFKCTFITFSNNAYSMMDATTTFSRPSRAYIDGGQENYS